MVLGPPESTTQTASRSVQPFCRAAEHGRFSRIRPVAPVRTTCNTCFLAPTQVHNPNCISIGSAIFAQLTAECRRACPGISFFLKLRCRMERSGPTPGPTWFPGPTRVQIPNCISIGSAVLTQLAAENHYKPTSQRVASFPLKLPLSTHIQYMIPSAHPNAQLKPHLDWFRRFSTADGRAPLYFRMGHPFPSKLPLRMGGSGPI